MSWSLTYAVALAAQIFVSGVPTMEGFESCRDSLDYAIFTSPRAANTRVPLHVIATTDEVVAQPRMLAMGPDGETSEVNVKAFGGPPFGWVATLERPQIGRWQFALFDGARPLACQRVRVRRRGYGDNEFVLGEDPYWKSRIKWERDTEAYFSVWLEHLFYAPPEEDLSWRPLTEVLRDQERNLLFNHLSLGEDRPGKRGLLLRPDCADLSYTLRAYFAWKLGLPFAMRGCTRGRRGKAPKCRGFGSNLMIAEVKEGDEPNRVKAFEYFARKKLAGTVHSSSGRTLPDDEQSDFYPVSMTRSALRPGTTFFDPYGHAMTVASWFPATDEKAGVLVAVDAQPDKTVGRRIFSRGSFLFPEDGKPSGAGFKRFRPVRKEAGVTVAMTNEQIAKSVDYGDFSLEQWRNGKEGFYEAMDALITPEPVPPERALVAQIDALEQQILRRVQSVNNAEQWKRKHRNRVIGMPPREKIFLTSGPWEDYSTPSRDMRLLIAMDAVLKFPQRLVNVPQRFILPPGKSPIQMRDEMASLLREIATQRKFSYTRSDGTSWQLTVGDVLDRAVAFEMAYNPNDCPEVRWAAPEGTEERRPCNVRAPSDHLDAMTTYRSWFATRVRPGQ